jgi:hypothetical protein
MAEDVGFITTRSEAMGVALDALAPAGLSQGLLERGGGAVQQS